MTLINLTSNIAIASSINSYSLLWFFVGFVFGIINLYFLQKLIIELLIVYPKNVLKIIGLMLIKFPLLYGTTLSLLFFDEIPFSLPFGFIMALATSVAFKYFESRNKKVIGI